MGVITINQTYKITEAGLVSPSLRRKAQLRGVQIDETPPDEHQIAICVEWLKRFSKPRRTVNRISSYSLKHCAERWAGVYVSNGAFIEATRRIGAEIIPVGNLNAVFKLSFDREALKMRIDNIPS